MTPAQLKKLRNGRANGGKLTCMYPKGYSRASWERSADAMVKKGWLEKTAFGDYFITDMGRLALDFHEISNQKETPKELLEM